MYALCVKILIEIIIEFIAKSLLVSLLESSLKSYSISISLFYTFSKYVSTLISTLPMNETHGQKVLHLPRGSSNYDLFPKKFLVKSSRGVICDFEELKY